MTGSPPTPPVRQLHRRSVPNDNSCLFYCLALLCQDAEPSKKVEQELRELCARSALTDPDPMTRALFLGQPTVDVYAEWIRNSQHWGGENEIVMLAEHFGVEVVVISCESLTSLCYGQGPKAYHRVYLLYTGQHYDPLVGVDERGGATPSAEEVRRFTVGGGACAADLEASALDVARQHNADAAKKAKQRRVKRIKCEGCGALLEDSAAFQEHCMEVEHDDDFAYGCEEVEVVIEEGEDLPEGSVDLTDEEKHFIFYNADEKSPLSSSWVGPASFEVGGRSYRTMEHYWQAVRYETSAPDLAEKIAAADTVKAALLLSNSEGIDKLRKDWDEAKADLLLKGLQAKFGVGKDCEDAVKALKATAPKIICCVDIDSWSGMSAAGGIATGHNNIGKSLQAVRDELLGGTSA